MILGPTAGGKSALAVALAERLDGAGCGAGEVVGADAFQVYRRLDAGTAKPDADLRARAPHHLIDLVEPTQRFTVHDWLQHATQTIADIQARGKTPIIVGGTNLYLKALIDGLFDGPGQDPAFRASLDTIATAELHGRLKQIDPDAADRVKPADRQRIVRALEVHERTGKPISEHQTQWREGGRGKRGEGADASHSPLGPSAPYLIGLRWSPESINPRINLRVKAMFFPDKVEPAIAHAVCINGESLVDEVRRLKSQGCFDPIQAEAGVTTPNQAREALGYKQLLAWMEGADDKIASLDDAFEKTKVLTRRFAKQQRTWLKRFTDARWIDCDNASADTITERAIALLSRDGGLGDSTGWH